jgi:hypothetical protein
MLIHEKEAHDYYCPFCFSTEKEDTMRCQGEKCMLWIYTHRGLGSCALAVYDEVKHSYTDRVLPK